MQIPELFAKKSTVFSIECFPPKQTVNFEKMKATLRVMSTLRPDFISVTYGAGGSAGGVSTCEVASFIKGELGVEPLAHILCMGNDRQSIDALRAALDGAGVHNVLALRGDRSPNRPESPDFAHASDLVAYLRERDASMGISGACYPEGHPESPTLRRDVANLRLKQEAGAGHLITQLFFDNGTFYRFLNMARKEGVTLPVSAGIMPIVKRSQIERTVALSSASLPSTFTKMIARWQDDPDSLRRAGVEYAITQMRDLIEGGADGVHLYAMNDANVAGEVYAGIRDLLPAPAKE